MLFGKEKVILQLPSLTSPINLTHVADEGNCALECMDKLKSALNALKWIPKTKTNLSIKRKGCKCNAKEIKFY